QNREHRGRAGGDPNVRTVAQFADERTTHQCAELRPFSVPADRRAFSLLRYRRRQRRRLLAPQPNLFYALNQSGPFVFVAPEFRRVTPGRDKLATTVLLVNDIAAQIAQRRFKNVENKFRAGCSAGRTSAEVLTERMLMLGLGKIAQHLGRRPEKDKPAALVEQDRLVK